MLKDVFRNVQGAGVAQRYSGGLVIQVQESDSRQEEAAGEFSSPG